MSNDKNVEAIDIANYIIEYYNETLEKPINNLKLQKLLYYIQAMWITEKQKLLFNDDIEKWKYGPVVPNVYFEFRHYGKNPIKAPLSTLSIEKDKMKFVEFNKNKINLSTEDFKKIDRVANRYKNTDPFNIVEQTHNEPMWSNYKNKILSGKRHLLYNPNEINKHFSKEDKKPWN